MSQSKDAPKKTQRSTRLKGRIISHVSASLVSFVFVLAMMQFDLNGLQGILVDLQFRLQLTKRPHKDVVLIAYDARSSANHYQSKKIPAATLGKIFDLLEQGEPKAVGILSPVDDRTYSDLEMELISDSFAKVPNTIVGYTDNDSYSRIQTSPLTREIRYLPGFVSRDTFSYGADSVSRRVMITAEGLPTLYGELARIYREDSEIPRFRHAHRYQKTGPMQVYINWQGGPGTYPIYSASEIEQDRISPSAFKDKVILIGTLLPSQTGKDFLLTPYSRDAKRTATLEGAAHGLATLMRDDGLFRTPFWFNTLFSILIGVLTVNLVLFLSPVRGILFVLVEVVFLFALSWVSFVFSDVWVDLAHPFVVACFGYYLVIPYRLVNEYRKRWHYQQKTELMAQLEQLKTNFLNLVSHDLKTPVARIQGNAELLLADTSIQSGPSRKNLNAIVQTSESLTENIETILDLTRIESAKVPLQKESHDINALILETVTNKQYLANEKAIELTTQLEPIFSFRFDDKLIRRVVANLVENAIKYSPDNSKVVVSTEEEDDWIRISVKDEGAGISESDQERIFTKFYRCSNESTEREKGTGLGLYLVRYFTELHKGFVDLKSEEGRGSIFTVALPA